MVDSSTQATLPVDAGMQTMAEEWEQEEQEEEGGANARAHAAHRSPGRQGEAARGRQGRRTSVSLGVQTEPTDPQPPAAGVGVGLASVPGASSPAVVLPAVSAQQQAQHASGGGARTAARHTAAEYREDWAYATNHDRVGAGSPALNSSGTVPSPAAVHAAADAQAAPTNAEVKGPESSRARLRRSSVAELAPELAIASGLVTTLSPVPAQLLGYGPRQYGAHGESGDPAASTSHRGTQGTPLVEGGRAEGLAKNKFFQSALRGRGGPAEARRGGGEGGNGSSSTSVSAAVPEAQSGLSIRGTQNEGDRHEADQGDSGHAHASAASPQGSSSPAAATPQQNASSPLVMHYSSLTGYNMAQLPAEQHAPSPSARAGHETSGSGTGTVSAILRRAGSFKGGGIPGSSSPLAGAAVQSSSPGRASSPALLRAGSSRHVALLASQASAALPAPVQLSEDGQSAKVGTSGRTVPVYLTEGYQPSSASPPVPEVPSRLPSQAQQPQPSPPPPPVPAPVSARSPLMGIHMTRASLGHARHARRGSLPGLDGEEDAAAAAAAVDPSGRHSRSPPPHGQGGGGGGRRGSFLGVQVDPRTGHVGGTASFTSPGRGAAGPLVHGLQGASDVGWGVIKHDDDFEYLLEDKGKYRGRRASLTGKVYYPTPEEQAQLDRTAAVASFAQERVDRHRAQVQGQGDGQWVERRPSPPRGGGKGRAGRGTAVDASAIVDSIMHPRPLSEAGAWGRHAGRGGRAGGATAQQVAAGEMQAAMVIAHARYAEYKRLAAQIARAEAEADAATAAAARAAPVTDESPTTAAPPAATAEDAQRLAFYADVEEEEGEEHVPAPAGLNPFATPARPSASSASAGLRGVAGAEYSGSGSGGGRPMPRAVSSPFGTSPFSQGVTQGQAQALPLTAAALAQALALQASIAEHHAAVLAASSSSSLPEQQRPRSRGRARKTNFAPDSALKPDSLPGLETFLTRQRLGQDMKREHEEALERAGLPKKDLLPAHAHDFAPTEGRAPVLLTAERAEWRAGGYPLPLPSHPGPATSGGAGTGRTQGKGAGKAGGARGRSRSGTGARPRPAKKQDHHSLGPSSWTSAPDGVPPPMPQPLPQARPLSPPAAAVPHRNGQGGDSRHVQEPSGTSPLRSQTPSGGGGGGSSSMRSARTRQPSPVHEVLHARTLGSRCNHGADHLLEEASEAEEADGGGGEAGEAGGALAGLVDMLTTTATTTTAAGGSTGKVARRAETEDLLLQGGHHAHARIARKRGHALGLSVGRSARALGGTAPRPGAGQAQGGTGRAWGIPIAATSDAWAHALRDGDVASAAYVHPGPQDAVAHVHAHSGTGGSVSPRERQRGHGRARRSVSPRGGVKVSYAGGTGVERRGKGGPYSSRSRSPAIGDARRPGNPDAAFYVLPPLPRPTSPLAPPALHSGREVRAHLHGREEHVAAVVSSSGTGSGGTMAATGGVSSSGHLWAHLYSNSQGEGLQGDLGSPSGMVIRGKRPPGVQGAGMGVPHLLDADEAGDSASPSADAAGAVIRIVVPSRSSRPPPQAQVSAGAGTGKGLGVPVLAVDGRTEQPTPAPDLASTGPSRPSPQSQSQEHAAAQGGRGHEYHLIKAATAGVDAQALEGLLQSESAPAHPAAASSTSAGSTANGGRLYPSATLDGAKDAHARPAVLPRL